VRFDNYLLGDHDGETGQRRSPDARDREELGETGDIVALAHDGRLDLQLAVDVVEVTRGLDRMKAEGG